ncbi:MAG: GDP-L-fucose synthase [Lentisphaeraceae bacterium]|nr:GDP-L-fucose synthase [Lentisphaeraceae bacterium]
MLEKDSKIYVAGHRGMVGSAIVRALNSSGYESTITKSREELDLTNQSNVREFYTQEKPDYVVIAAAKVGGIHANNEYPADFIYENLMIECNLIHEAHNSGVQNLLFLGSSCIYPKLAAQPMVESSLLTGKLETTNEPYAIAKIAGIKLCESYNRQFGTDYRSIMPTNLYGPGDNFHPVNSHVIPALIRKFHTAVKSNAPSVEVWGTGAAYREFLHVDDLASACLYVMNLPKEELAQKIDPMNSHINIGTGQDLTIKELVLLLKEVSGFSGEIIWNTDKPDGTPKKQLDISLIKSLGWEPTIELSDGLREAYSWFDQNIAD